jgi:putative mRNA 3-end processing factor
VLPSSRSAVTPSYWWRANQDAGKASILFAYPLGKSQRLSASLDHSIGPVFAHESIERLSQIYRAEGVPLPANVVPDSWKRALILAPPGLHGSAWSKKLGAASTALASGWMRIRGTRRRQSLDRGFVISDHADWSQLLRAIDETHAETVWVTHGYRTPLVRWLHEHGRQAFEIAEPQPRAEPQPKKVDA